MTRRISLTVAAVVLGVLAAGCGSSSSGGGNSTLAQSNQPAAGCSAPPTTKPTDQQFKHEPPITISRTTYTARIVTNCGTIVMSLDGKAAPHTVNSFNFLAGKGYFNHTPCHRLTTSGIFVLQCGDPTGTGTGGPGYTIPEENLEGATYPAGTVAMARAQAPHSGGSQFFLVYANTELPPQYTPFGHITTGLNILQDIAKAGTDNTNGPGDGHPNQHVQIESFTVTKGAP